MSMSHCPMDRQAACSTYRQQWTMRSKRSLMPQMDKLTCEPQATMSMSRCSSNADSSPT